MLTKKLMPDLLHHAKVLHARGDVVEGAAQPLGLERVVGPVDEGGQLADDELAQVGVLLNRDLLRLDLLVELAQFDVVPRQHHAALAEPRLNHLDFFGDRFMAEGDSLKRLQTGGRAAHEREDAG